MKKYDSMLFTPHQVASFFSISKDTLLYYDRIGLFSPIARRENGYRCYSAAQLSELDTILTLKELGIPLSSIKDSIARISAPSFVSLLENEERSLRRRIDECRSLLDTVVSIRTSISEAQQAEKGRLYIADCEAKPVLEVPIATASETETTEVEWQKAYSALMALPECKSIMGLGSIVRLDEARRYLGNICRKVYAICANAHGTIPAGRYAYMFFSGSLERLSSFYQAFFAALDDEKLEPQGDIYEELTISDIATRNADEYVTKLMVRV